MIFLSRKNKTKQNANSIVTCKTFLWYATHRNTLCLYTKPKILILTELIVFFKMGENQSFHFFQLLATALMTEQYSMTGREKENWKLIFTFTQHQTAAAAASVSSAQTRSGGWCKSNGISKRIKKKKKKNNFHFFLCGSFGCCLFFFFQENNNNNLKSCPAGLAGLSVWLKRLF